MHADRGYRLLGKPGRYHVVVYIMLCCNYFPVVLNHLAMAIYGARTAHHCHLPDNAYPNTSIPWDAQKGSPQSCLVYVNYTKDSGETESCSEGWDYDLGPRESNIISEFDLVCDKAYLSSLATTIYFCGVMFGGLLFGTLSDHWGRKPFTLGTLYMHIVVGVFIAFSNSYVMFVLLRFLQGILMQGLQTCTFVLIMELFTSEYRTLVGTVFEVFWGVGVLWLASVGFLLQNWRHIQLLITLPSILAIVYLWTIPESPRWLLAHKKYNEAESVLRKAAKFNSVTLPDDPLGVKANDDSEVIVIPKTKRKYTILDMFKTPKLRHRSLIMFYIWLVTAVGYYGLSLSITSLAGNKYLNLFIGGCVELPAYCAAVFILNRFGRRKPLCVYLLIGGVFCISAGLVNYFLGDNRLKWLPTLLAVIGRFGSAGCFSVVLLYTCELFPTVIRNVSMGACAFWTRIGGVVAPQILLLGQFTYTWLPVVVLGTMSLIGSVATLFLPETLHKHLPDTIEEAEDIHNNIPARDAENEALNGDSQIEVTDNIKQPALQDETLL